MTPQESPNLKNLPHRGEEYLRLFSGLIHSWFPLSCVARTTSLPASPLVMAVLRRANVVPLNYPAPVFSHRSQQQLEQSFQELRRAGAIKAEQTDRGRFPRGKRC